VTLDRQINLVSP